MVSIKDIAKHAGVSISTVSCALNGSDKVTKETTAKILKIAEELNYVPHAAARLLKTKKSNMIGIFLRDFSGSFYGDLLQGIKDFLSVRGYDLLVCSGAQSRRLIAERMIDGSIILDATFTNEELLQYMKQGHKAVVLDRELDHSHINQVLLDNKAGATLALEYLIEQGHTNIYIVTGPTSSYDASQRLRAVKQVIERNPMLDIHEITGDFTKAAGEVAAKHIASEYTTPIAVFCLNDEMAIGVYSYISNHTDLVIGEHIHLIGFDNIELSQFVQPRLTTINYSMRKWGALASEQLLKMLNDETVDHERVYVTLVEGASVRSSG
ncbi:LacI family DNA-binding transcriptional regulator [Paenibacillus sp. GSMTC-2017]|uniref:LacI family DNA-binding transcriptional regulator n=1 Tax=Paenibacillus sp. GSMTC-2017 TaxID=2794350 RepID=UPI0018D72FD6|nr:LacI family DNA-binding transcriptional regulator [Paenibacillus sp. GSMTC-2017]MBH5318384.1 LacI family DNA-binding transcriptional regulator [Paenibacillus sp. GSMTC-2017]